MSGIHVSLAMLGLTEGEERLAATAVAWIGRNVWRGDLVPSGSV